MKWVSSVSDEFRLDSAIEDSIETLRMDLGDLSPDLTIVFVSSHHATAYDQVPKMVQDYVGNGLLIGCSGGGVIGAGLELENRPGFSLTSANLPGVELIPFHIEEGSLPNADAPPSAWEELVGVTQASNPQFLLLVDPTSTITEDLIAGLDYAFPKSVKIGGVVSGTGGPSGNALYLGQSTFTKGVIGIAMYGEIAVDTIIAQGCKPIGKSLKVSSCNRNILQGLDGVAPLELIREIYSQSNDSDQALFSSSLFVGVVMDKFNDFPKQGDFKIRNIIGVNERTGVLAVDEALVEGQIVQFHLRDVNTASQDLDRLLDRYNVGKVVRDGSGALLFSCLGRGLGLYGRPNHDTGMFLDKVSQMPLTGFFCNGEIGPVGSMTFLHSYTSVFGVFRPQ